MTEPPTLFDTPPEPPARKGERLREDGIDRARLGTDEEWYRLAWRAVQSVRTLAATFTTDDVWAKLDEWGAPAPPEPRAMGAIMRDVKRHELAVPTDRTRLSERPECHRRPIRIWRTT